MAQMDHDSKFPCMLDKDGPLTKHRIMDAHVSMNHGGPELTKTKLRAKFWILKITNKIKVTIKECFSCKRASGPPFRKPTTPALPEFRVTFRPYEILGIDATGHVLLKNEVTGEKEKHYILIMTCANIRHISLELIPDTTAKSVMDALKIHSSYCSAPKIILADNASYFKLTEKVLTEELGRQQIRFLYNPVHAPWYGSIWERMIGVFKLLLRKTIQRRLLTPREMNLYLKETSTIVNNRPLTAASNDIRDMLPLTPNKLLFGKDLFTLSQGHHDEDPEDISFNPDDNETLKHWRLHDTLIKEMKERFNTEYMTALRERHHYDHHQGPVCKADIGVGDIVIMKGDKHRMLWELAEVKELLPGKDNEVRAVKLHTSTGETSRPICLLYPLVKKSETQPQKGNEKGQEEQEQQESVTQDQEEVIHGEVKDGEGDSEETDLPRRPKGAAAQRAEEKTRVQGCSMK